MIMSSANLDSIFADLGKNFGKYQIKNYIFICIPIIYSALFTLGYVFTSRDLNYRCYIPECDSLETEPIYKPVWLKNAVPFIDKNYPSKCEKYFAIPGLNNTEGHCPTSVFNYSLNHGKCNEFIFETSEITILNDFNLTCNENMWKLTMTGTINNIGQFVCLGLTGFVSDRYGRRFVLLSGLLMATVIGTAKSFAPNYLIFLFLEFLGLAIGTGAGFSSAFILGVEQVAPEKRVLATTILSSAYAIGESLLGLIAMFITDWRWFLRIIYVSGVFIISLFWLTPESLRWMLTKGKKEEAKEILRKMAKINKIDISENVLKELNISEDKKETEHNSIQNIFTSRILLLRLMNCSFCWVTCVFIFYGLTLNSVTVSGNVYMNFIFVSLIEIPAYVVTYLIMDRFGRRSSLCGALLLSGLACVSFLFIPEVSVWAKMSAYLLGKFGATIAYTVLYIFTAELFPTVHRHSYLATCSMFGRIGSMVAPQTPLLGMIMKSLPIIIFATMSLLSGLLVLVFPETLHTQLPDTVQQAEMIGREKLLNTSKETA